MLIVSLCTLACSMWIRLVLKNLEFREIALVQIVHFSKITTCFETRIHEVVCNTNVTFTYLTQKSIQKTQFNLVQAI